LNKDLYSIVDRNVQQARKMWSQNSQPFKKNAGKSQGGYFFLTHPVDIT